MDCDCFLLLFEIVPIRGICIIIQSYCLSRSEQELTRWFAENTNPVCNISSDYDSCMFYRTGIYFEYHQGNLLMSRGLKLTNIETNDIVFEFQNDCSSIADIMTKLVSKKSMDGVYSRIVCTKMIRVMGDLLHIAVPLSCCCKREKLMMKDV